jgi:mannobiose 2-epimerase
MTDPPAPPRKKRRSRHARHHRTWRGGVALRRTVIKAGAVLVVTALGWLVWWMQPKPATLGDYVHYGWVKRSFVSDLLQPWYDGAVQTNGFMQPRLDRRWQAREPYTTTLMSQCRLLYLMAMGYEVTHEGKYQDAVLRGGDFLLDHFRDPKTLRWCREVDRDGKTVDAAAPDDDIPFVIFALAHAFEVTQQDRFRAVALATWSQGNWEGLVRARALARGQQSTAVAVSASGTRTYTGMLHLFEALLALQDATSNPAVGNDVAALAAFLEQRLYQPKTGRLPWRFTADWRPLPASEGGLINLGYQVEWAYDLSLAVRRGLSEHYLALAQALLNDAISLGYDRTQGGLFESADYEGKRLGKRKEAWQQAQLLCALMHFATIHGRTELWPLFNKSLNLVQTRFLDRVNGGWFQRVDALESADPRATDKGDIGLSDRHVTDFYIEALALHALTGNVGQTEERF